MVTLVRRLEKNEEMIFEVTSGFSGFGFTAKKKRFRGSCTVWHEEETGKRAGLFIERMLADAWNRYRRTE